MLKELERRRERERKKKMRNLFSQNLWLKMAKRFSALLQFHIGNPPRPWKRNSLAPLQKWACLWLSLISGFVCGASGSSCGFAGDPQAFCLISRGGLCSAPAAFCWHTLFVLPLHVRFGHRSRITGNTAITGTPMFVSSTTTVSAQEGGGKWISIWVRESEVR